MDLVHFLSPKNVILVHGEKPKMATLKERIQSELGIPCYDPANNETVSIPTTHYVKAVASDTFIRSCSHPSFKFSKNNSEDGHGSSFKMGDSVPQLQVSDERVAEGILVIEKSKKAKVLHQDELLLTLGENENKVQFAYCCPVHVGSLEETKSTDIASPNNRLCMTDRRFWLQKLLTRLSNEFSGGNIQDFGEHLQVESFHVSTCLKENCPLRISDTPQGNISELVFFCCAWSVADERIAQRIISILKNIDSSSAKGTH